MTHPNVVKRPPAKDPAESFLEDHIQICRDLVEGGESRIPVGVIARHHAVLEREYGPVTAQWIKVRARAAVRELIGGEPAPPVARLDVDGPTVVNCDILAERLVDRYRSIVTRSSDPKWRDALNARFAKLCTEHDARLDRAANAKAPSADRTGLAAEVRALRAELDALRGAGLRYRGVWQAAEQYGRGDCVTRDGSLWHRNSPEPTTEKPGTGTGWTLMHKGAR